MERRAEFKGIMIFIIGGLIVGQVVSPSRRI